MLSASFLFHRISRSDKPSWHPESQLCIAPAAFESFVKVLSKRFNPISIEELFYFHSNSIKIPGKSVLLTCDDGYSDNLHIMLPIVEKYKVPVTVYVTTGFVEGSHFPYQQLIANYLIKSKKVSFEFKKEQFHFPLENFKEKEYCFQKLRRLGRHLKISESKAFLEAILGQGFERENYSSVDLFLTPEELIELNSSNLITIGAHTKSHHLLANLSEDQQLNEISESRRSLGKILNGDINHFAYPSGSYNSVTLKVLNSLKFKTSITTNKTYIPENIENIFEIPRFTFHKKPGFFTPTFKSFVENCASSR